MAEENSRSSHGGGGGGGGGSVTVNIKEGEVVDCHINGDDNTVICKSTKKQDSLLSVSVPFMQKLIAEVVGTYFLIFAGCAAVAVNAQKDKVVSLTGISIVWGLAVMVLVYSVGHISGAHFNPAVTLAFASCRRFPLKQVPAYVMAQLLGSTLAAATLRLMFDLHHDVCSGKHDVFVGTLPSGSNLQSLSIEFIITFYLMFIVSGVATDNRAIGELAGLAVGATVLLNVLFAGAVSGASMNPARTLGPAMVFGCYKGIWVYMVGPILGAISGAWVYNMVRYTDKPLREITNSASFLKGSRSSRN